jgi:hypothetical protein
VTDKRKKLTDAEVMAILRLHRTGAMNQKEIAAEYGITREHVSRLCTGKTRCNLTATEPEEPFHGPGPVYSDPPPRWNARLNRAKVLAIREHYANGARLVDLSSEFDVSPATIHHIVTRKTWKHI